MSRAITTQRVDDLLRLVGLSEARTRQLRKFSKGMLQRIGLAQSLIHDPELVILDERSARLTLHEGRYHQVKRMFHRVGNRVRSLHRESIGAITLPADLPPGAWRALTDRETQDAAGGA